MDVEMKEPSSDVPRESGDPLEVADEDVYPRLKALQRQQEFVGIQVMPIKCCAERSTAQEWF